MDLREASQPLNDKSTIEIITINLYVYKNYGVLTISTIDFLICGILTISTINFLINGYDNLF